MKKIVFLTLSVVSIFAFNWSGKVDWSISYQSAKSIAAKEHKLVMVDISLSHCPPCRYLASHVYTNKKVADYLNKNFISVSYLADKESIPNEVQYYFRGSTPTILFIKPNGKLFTYFIGARRPTNFLSLLRLINNKYKNIKK